NLIQNSADAIAKLEEKWIKLVATSDKYFLTISVEDSGPGIPPELRERILEPFFTTKEVGKGTGLGLPISAGMIKDHGGELTIDSRSSHTKFVIRIPLKHVELKAA